MQIEIIQNGQILRTIHHEGQTYVEAPTSGKYSLRVRNESHGRKLAVISVDGINVINGEDAGVDGGGYVLSSYQTVDVLGFRRDDGTVAAFEFSEQGGSYAAKTGRGTSNVGVIGLAVFDEKVPVHVPQPRCHIFSGGGMEGGGGMLRSCSFGGSTNDSGFVQDSLCSAISSSGTAESYSSTTIGATRSRVSKSASVKDVGTAYGEEVSFHTTETSFARASTKPSVVLALRYATLARLKSWGVPVELANTGPQAANPFPASQADCPAPPGWGG